MARREIGWLCILLFVAACGARTPNVITATPRTPTIVPTTLVPSPTQLVRGTLPPSWTPIFSWTPTKTLTPSITPTFTATYTASLTYTASNTFTPSWTPTPNATNIALQNQPLAPECKAFGPDPLKNPRNFTVTTAPAVSWTPVSTAAAYLVRLYDNNHTTLLTQTTTETSMTFPADLFTISTSYAWEVAPVDSDGIQLCPARGALLFPTP